MTRETEHTIDIDADRAIMAFVRQSRKSRILKRLGPFLLLFEPSTNLRFLNYAIPDDDAEPSSREIDALVDAFKEADRMPRLEFLPSVAPALETLLIASGFSVEQRLPLMTCTRASLVRLSPPDSVSLSAPSDDATLRAMASLQHGIFDDPDPVDANTVARLRGALGRGDRALVAIDGSNHTVIAAAQAMGSASIASEIGGVAVASSHRRRGIAAAVVSTLAGQCLDSGMSTVFLEATPGADGAYRNAGFRRTSTSLHISLADDPSA